MIETKIINGRQIRDEILEDVKKDIEALSFAPVFCDVLVGDDAVSVQYVNMKKKTAISLGIAFHDAQFPDSITTEELVAEIKKINTIPRMSGVIVQLPLPPHIDQDQVVNAIDPRLDVDCLGEKAREDFYNNKNDNGYPAALACVHILDSLNLPLSEKNIVIVGQGELVGRPVAHILRNRELKVVTLSRETKNNIEIIKQADVIISATGQGKFVDGAMIKEGAVVIDAGTSEKDGGVIGDVESVSVSGVALYLSKVPGGVGPVTIALLLKNIVQIAQSHASMDIARHEPLR